MTNSETIVMSFLTYPLPSSEGQIGDLSLNEIFLHLVHRVL